MKNATSVTALLIALSSAAIANTDAEPQPEMQQLLVGELLADTDKPAPFSLQGPSREKPEGGTLTAGEDQFTIQSVSVHRMIGAKGKPESATKFAVFSSSYSDQTATGTPWVAANTSYHCDEPYNSFLAIYTVSDAKKMARLGEVPYPKLIDAKATSDESVIYCFMARPPKQEQAATTQ